MKTVYVRWLGAFGGYHYGLRASIAFEMQRKDEAACEPVRKSNGHLTPGVWSKWGVGLLVRNEAIFREFRADCWSYYGQDSRKSTKARKDQAPNRLYADSPASTSDHAEAWAKMDNAIYGIVLSQPLAETKQDIRNAVLRSARRFSLPVYSIRKGALIEERGVFDE